MTEEISGPGKAAPPAPKSRSRLVLPVVLAIVALAVAAVWQFMPPLESPAVTDGNPVAPDAGDKLTEAGAQVTQPPAQPEPVPAQPEAVPAQTPEPSPETESPTIESDAQLTPLVQALNDAESKLASMSGTITALTERIAALEAAAPSAAMPEQLAFAFGLRELERALAGSGPFEIELQAVAKLAGLGPQEPTIAELQKYAAEGIPSRSTLITGFAPVAGAVVRADAVDRQLGISGWLYSWISALITVRPVGERAGDDAPAIVARAEARLAGGDLEAAVQELGGLRNSAALAAAPWLADAQARLSAEQALAKLNAQLTSGQE